jgi:hypothetical protein
VKTQQEMLQLFTADESTIAQNKTAAYNNQIVGIRMDVFIDTTHNFKPMASRGCLMNIEKCIFMRRLYDAIG